MVAKPSAVTPPTSPDRDNPATFSDLADAYIAWLTATGFPYIGDAMDYAAQQIEQLGASAPDWVSGASYTDSDVARSLSDRLVYQAITTHSGETTDPASDATNWTRLTVGAAANNTFTGSNTFEGDVDMSAVTNKASLRSDIGIKMMLVGVQVFSTAGADTYTPSAGVTKARAILIGGGGGGAGADSDANSSETGCGGGGAGGSWIKTDLLDVSAGGYSATLNIGAGAASVAGASDGSSGADTTWSDGTNSFTAPGGGGGFTRSDRTTSTAALGGSPGNVSTTTSTIAVGSGQAGGVGVGHGDSSSSAGGTGGASLFGGGGRAGRSNSNGFAGDGEDGASPGAGGGGGATVGASLNADGGAGADGIIIVEEYAE